MLNKIKQFQKDAEKLGTDKNSVAEFKQWVEAQKKESDELPKFKNINSFIFEIIQHSIDQIEEEGGRITPGKVKHATKEVEEWIIDLIQHEGNTLQDLSDFIYDLLTRGEV